MVGLAVVLAVVLVLGFAGIYDGSPRNDPKEGL